MENKCLNKVELQGRVGEVKRLVDGNNIKWRFSVVTTQFFKNSLESAWLVVEAAENENCQGLSELQKGDFVSIVGGIRMEQYTDSIGGEYIGYYIHAASVNILERDIPHCQSNKVELKGRVGTIRHSFVNGVEKWSFSVATNQIIKTDDDASSIETTWHTVDAVENENCQDLSKLQIGDFVSVVGRITTRRYADSEGQEHTQNNIRATSVSIENKLQNTFKKKL